MPLKIREERDEDLKAIQDVNAKAFGRSDEGHLVDRLRSQGYSRISSVAEVDGQVVGHILFSTLMLESERTTIEGLALAPLAVVPDHQRQGIGSELIREGLRLCSQAGSKVVVVLGHPDYYPRFGFSPALAERFISLYAGPALMALEFEPGILGDDAWKVQYAPPFDSSDH